MGRLGPLFMVLCVGCGAARPNARTALSELLDALANADAPTVARLTGRSETATRALLEDTRDEHRALGAAAETAPIELRGRAYLAGGGVIAMVHEDGEWHVASGLLGVASLETPLDAIRALHAVLGRVRETGIEAVLSRGSRLALDEELDRWLRGTADPDALELAIDGDTATATTPAGGTIELRREAGEWRIVDLR